ncbi:MAG: TetR/AcrR family transcriptional regulator [Anaerolineae bacterium]
MTERIRKPDRRIERTHQLLSKALMELIIERGYESITIQDITDRANVSRTTFYLHFRDKDELLFASMQQIYDGLISNHGGFMKGEFSEDDFDTLQCDASDFVHVAEYADFYRVMLSKQGSAVFILRVMSYIAEAMKAGLTQKADGAEPKIPLDLIAAFCAGAEVGVMKWWLEHDMRYSPEEMARMQAFLSSFGLRWALGQEQPETSAP